MYNYLKDISYRNFAVLQWQLPTFYKPMHIFIPAVFLPFKAVATTEILKRCGKAYF
jgi:hypothetical protein